MDIIQKTRDDYNKIAKHFATTRYDTWPELEQFKSFLASGQCILDWGCGAGRLLLFLKDHAIKYFGVDQSNELLKIAKKKYAAEIKQGGARFFCTANKAKKFPEQYFDLVFMVASFLHLPDVKSRLNLLKKTYREMKSGGRLIMTVWNLGSDWAKTKKFKKIGENDWLVPWKNADGKVEVERYYHHFRKEELSDLLAKANFKIEKMDYFDGTWTDSKGGRNLVVVAIKP